MKKHDYFRLFISKALYTNIEWVFPLFSLVMGDEQLQTQKHTNVPAHLAVHEDIGYKLIYGTLGYGYVDPNDHTKVIPITDAVIGEPLFTAKDLITLEPGDLPNVKEKTETTIGRAFLNAVLFATTVGDKIPFINKKLSPTEAENLIFAKLHDTPSDHADRKQDEIYVDEYLMFVDAAMDMCSFMQLFVPGATYKSMTPPPNNNELRAKLLEQYKGHLNDPKVVAIINRELQKNDAEYLKGDPCEGFLISRKSREVVRTKKFLMYGGEPGLEDKHEVETITNSLNDGWDMSHYVDKINTLRARSYNRSVETAMGGVTTKDLLRSSSNIVASVDDCGSTLGNPIFLDADMLKKYEGFTALFNGNKFVIGKDTADLLLDKPVLIRTPLLCRLGATDYCKTCVGPRLALNPTAISAAVSNKGSALMLLFMKAAHSKTLTLRKMDINRVIS